MFKLMTKKNIDKKDKKEFLLLSSLSSYDNALYITLHNLSKFNKLTTVSR